MEEQTNRRDFLQGLASIIALAGVTAPTAGCLNTQQARQTPLDLDGTLRWLSQMESKILATPLIKDTKNTPPLNARATAKLDLVRRLMSGLMIVGIHNDLPKSMQQDPKMQAFLKSKAPAFNQMTLELLGYMESLTPAQRAEIQLDMKSANTSATLKAMIDQKYVEYGVPSTRRKQFDQMYSEIGWRMKHQPPTVLIDEILGKVDRKITKAGLPKAKRQALSNAALADMYKRCGANTATTGKAAAPAKPAGKAKNAPVKVADPPGYRPPPPSKDQQRAMDKDKPRTSLDDMYADEQHAQNSGYRYQRRGPNRTLLAGGIVMGIAAGLGLLSILFFALGGGGVAIGLVMGPTIGGSAFIAGLITLIVGAARGW